MIGKIFIDIFILLILDIILSVDNAILISMVTKDLKGKDRRIASIFGALGAVFLRLVFVILLALFFSVLSDIPVVYILGGILLLWVGWSITKTNNDNHSKVKSSSKIFKAIAIVIGADIMMSFDNALIISEVVVGMEFNDDISSSWDITIKTLIVAIALLISLILIVFSSNLLGKFMEKNRWIIYVGCWLLMSVSVEMILKDSLIHEHLPGEHYLWTFFSYWMGGILTMINWFWREINGDNKKSKEKESLI